ncbi:MAG: hypothetical protein RIQ81_370 [Pseudomonadota bacterium]|jgi:hypothetical protein
MLDFIFALERFIQKWPAGAQFTIFQIAELTKTQIAVAVDALAVALSRELDVQDVISLDDAKKALGDLEDRMQVHLAARRKRIEQQRDAAVKAYDATMEKVRVLQMSKNWRNAYKTLGYFAGRHEANLPVEILMAIYGDCVRLGVKSGANLQELGVWFKKGLDLSVLNINRDSVAEAIDFIDAYGDMLVQAGTGGAGQRLVSSALQSLAMPATEFELAEEWRNVAIGFNVGTVALT